MIKLAIKFLVLALPFVSLVAIEMFVLPMEFFTFRNWEALFALNFRPAEGPFYPDRHIARTDARGDYLGLRDDRPKKVEWYTDHEGSRNRLRAIEPDRYDIVLVGDSLIVGSYLDQKDALGEVLERKCDCSAFAFGVMPKNGFFFDPNFQRRPPRAVVIEMRTGEAYKASALKMIFNASFDDISTYVFSVTMPAASPFPRWATILADRVSKANMLQSVRSRLSLQLKNNAPPEREISLNESNEFLVKLVTEMNKEAHRRDTEFVLLVIPSADRTIDDAVIRLKHAGVKVLAYLPGSKDSTWASIDHFFSERDSHWTEETVRDTADKLLAVLGWPNKQPKMIP